MLSTMFFFFFFICSSIVANVNEIVSHYHIKSGKNVFCVIYKGMAVILTVLLFIVCVMYFTFN